MAGAMQQYDGLFKGGSVTQRGGQDKVNGRARARTCGTFPRCLNVAN